MGFLRTHQERSATTNTGDALEQRRRVVRQSQQSRRFVGEYLADSALGFVRAAPVGSRAIAPGIGLGVEIVEIGEVAGRERTRQLQALRDWLKATGVTHVGMESTGVYWRPVYAVL